MRSRHRLAATPAALTRAAITSLLALLLTIAGTGIAQAASSADRWSPASPHRSARFSTTDVRWSDGAVTTTVIPAEQLPLGIAVEQEVATRLGTDRIRAGVTGWNGIAGSRFSASLAGTVDDRLRAPRADGVHRIFLDETCEGEELAWAYIEQVASDDRYGMRGGYALDLDIGVCRRLLAQPEKTASTIRHELGHLLGLAHVEDDCRVMAAKSSPCQRMSAADHEAVRYLYPKMPRLAGPSRLETSARSVYATRPDAGQAMRVVMVDGFGPSTLPVTAAAYAGAMSAPMLLVGQECATGVVGDELRRVAARGAEVVLVGAGIARCRGEIERAGYRPVTVPSPAAVAERFGLTVDTIFVVRGPLADGSLPDGVTAAAAAGWLGAPILLTDGGDELAGWSRDYLRTHLAVKRAIVVGGEQAVPPAVVEELRARGISVQRRAGQDRIDTALAIATTPDVFPSRGPAVVVSADRWADAVAGSALGAANGWPVLLTPTDRFDGRVGSFLEQKATGGYVVGGKAVVSDAVFVAANGRLR